MMKQIVPTSLLTNTLFLVSMKATSDSLDQAIVVLKTINDAENLSLLKSDNKVGLTTKTEKKIIN